MQSSDLRLRVACLQFSPGEDLDANARTAIGMAREAAAGGARLLLLPEYASVLHASGRVMRQRAVAEQAHPLLQELQALARVERVWILIGSLTVPVEDGRIANRSIVLSDTGEVVARYDKIHMFDATLSTGRTIRESSSYRPGDRAVLAPTPWGKLGLSICYDVRFPYLYRSLATAGASMLAIPAAFTDATGPLHWHTLVRARAIENACFVLAPATCGTHPGEHATYGHSLVVDPQGKVLVDGGRSAGVYCAEIDLADVERARGMIPSLSHTTDFTSPA